MAKSPTQPSVATSLAQNGGLGTFRSVASRATQADGPLGPPTKTARADGMVPRRVAEPSQIQARAEPPQFTETVSLPMTAQLRMQGEAAARAISNNRTIRSTRVTPNSVYRVAIQVFLERLDIGSLPPLNSESEMLQFFRSQLK